MLKTILLFLCLIFLTCTVYATAEYAAVNHITRQYTIFEDVSGRYIPLFWEPVGEYNTNNIEVYGASLGYTYTTFPYIIECIIFLFLCTILLFFTAYCIIKKP